jgi:hypothetical protein
VKGNYMKKIIAGIMLSIMISFSVVVPTRKAQAGDPVCDYFAAMIIANSGLLYLLTPGSPEWNQVYDEIEGWIVLAGAAGCLQQ